MKFQVKVLGSSSALPAQGRHPSCHVLNARDHLYLIDCGEGTQIQMHRFGVKRGKIDHIFISHLHGDHVFGLVPLLSSYALYQREAAIHIYGPKPLDSFIRHQLECMGAKLPFPMTVHELSHEGIETIMDDQRLKVSAFPLHHRIDTFAYVFEEQPRLPHILPDKLDEYDLDFSLIPKIKQQEMIEGPKGEKIPTELLTEAAEPPRSYAYMSDTAYDPDFAKYIEGVDMLYHEATFVHALKERAEKTMHSTAKEAAQLAKKAEVGKLLLGHFSSRYSDLDVLLHEARAIFKESYLAIEGEDFLIDSNS